MRKSIYLLPLLLLLCHFSIAQTVRVIDKTTLQPLTGVAISTVSGTDSIRTGAGGRADISQINPSEYKLRFSYIGYQTRTLTPTQLQQSDYEVVLAQQSHNLHEVVVSAGRLAEDSNSYCSK